MEDVMIHEDAVEEAKAAAKAFEASLNKTNVRCETLISYVASASWSSKTRDSFFSYLEIIKQYHEDIAQITAKQTKALNNLDTYTNDFLKDPLVKQVRNL